MTISWPSLMRTARRLVRLTQEDFAADLGRSQSAVALWENGRRPIPPAVRRRVLDILAGYYHRRPEYEALTSQVAAAQNPVTVYRPGMFVQTANPMLLTTWAEHRLDMIGACILPMYRTGSRILEMVDTQFSAMLSGTSEVLSISFNDRSVMMPWILVRRTATVYPVGEGRLLRLDDHLIGEAPGTALPAADLTILTADDVSDASSDRPGTCNDELS